METLIGHKVQDSKCIPSSGILRQNSPARGFVQIWQFSGSPSDYFLLRVRFSCCFTATSACALQAASLKKCTHTTFVPNFAYRTKHLTLQSMCFADFVACPTCKVREGNRRGVWRQMGAASKIHRKEFLVTCQKTFGDEKRKTNSSVHFYWLLATSYFYSTTFNRTFGQVSYKDITHKEVLRSSQTLPTQRRCVAFHPNVRTIFPVWFLFQVHIPFCFESRFRGGFVRLHMVTMRKKFYQSRSVENTSEATFTKLKTLFLRRETTGLFSHDNETTIFRNCSSMADKVWNKTSWFPDLLSYCGTFLEYYYLTVSLRRTSFQHFMHCIRVHACVSSSYIRLCQVRGTILGLKVRVPPVWILWIHVRQEHGTPPRTVVAHGFLNDVVYPDTLKYYWLDLERVHYYDCTSKIPKSYWIYRGIQRWEIFTKGKISFFRFRRSSYSGEKQQFGIEINTPPARHPIQICTGK